MEKIKEVVEETVETVEATAAPVVETKAEETVEVETTPEVKKLELDEKEFEQRLNNKYAEGAKKAEKNLLDELGYKSKEELQNAITAAKELQDNYNSTAGELSQLKAERLAIKLGATAEVAENVVALLKGKGQEISEENIKTAMAIFQGAKPASQGFGTPPTQRTSTNTKKAPPKLF